MSSGEQKHLNYWFAVSEVLKIVASLADGVENHPRFKQARSESLPQLGKGVNSGDVEDADGAAPTNWKQFTQEDQKQEL